MKYLITICLAAIAIAFLHESGKSFQEQIRAESRMRVLMFKSYAEHHRGNRQSGSDPKVECPRDKTDEPKLQKEKL